MGRAGRALLAWLEARAVAIAAEQGLPSAPAATHHWQAEGSDLETAKTAVLTRAGYTPVRYFYEMVRPDLENIRAVSLPAGLAVRPVQPEHIRAIWQVAAAVAFQDHWGETEQTEEDYERFRNSSQFQPEIWKVAWDTATNQVAGWCSATSWPKRTRRTTACAAIPKTSASALPQAGRRQRIDCRKPARA